MWLKNKEDIVFKKYNKILFCDSYDHWKNGVCRLLNLKEEVAKDWIEFLFKKSIARNWNKLSFLEKYEHLISSTNIYFNSKNSTKLKENIIKKDILGNKIDKHFASLEQDGETFHIIGSKFLNHGILVDKKYRSVSAIKYEEEYFEGEVEKVGYGNYKRQANWRIEKSKNLLKMIFKYTDVNKNPIIMDIGAGYGFFRYAADKLGIQHKGLEISKYANKMCKELFGYKNYESEIWNFKRKEKYDIVTCFDVIEHISNIDEFLKKIKKILKKDGVLVIRTPNLNSFEYKCFGSKFYSLKTEHLNYFSPASLSLYLSNNNFTVIHAQTTSHMFSGFYDFSLDVLKSNMQGSDIFLIGKLNEKY